MNVHEKTRTPLTPVTREYTVNLCYYIRGKSAKRRAPSAIKGIRMFAHRHMHTKDVRVAIDVNKYIWSCGIRNVPRHVRVRMSRRINESEKSKGNYYTLVTLASVPEARGLKPQVIDDDSTLE